jgi:Cryptococcal mannosyltransferase 1
MPSDIPDEEHELLETDPYDSHGPEEYPYARPSRRQSFTSSPRRLLVSLLRLLVRGHTGGPYKRPLPSRRFSLLKLGLYFLVVLLVFTAFFRPSYTHPPAHYGALQQQVLASKTPGRGNPNNEKVFIAIALYDKGGHLARGPWAQNLLDLIDFLGPENAFLSIYENNSGEEGERALRAFEARVPCEKEIVYEEVDRSEFPSVIMPNGERRVKRVLYLSDLRNRALRPLDRRSDRSFDKVLFFNDVFFNPIDAVQLLFSTNVQANGKADYVVACALDFHNNPIKFYDVYATRDLEGYSMGVPFYPFFSHAGQSQTRNDMLAQKDAVRVKSCWSGMAAFQARYIQAMSREKRPGIEKIGYSNVDPVHPEPVTPPARFRAEPEIFFDACECCLLVADTIKLAKGTTSLGEDSGVYVNPYVRVGYSERVLWWLRYTRRIERLYSWPHWIVDALANMPTWNAHREVLEGQKFQEEVWISEPAAPGGGHWEIQERRARNGMYCGVREMQLLLEERRKADKNWENAEIPQGRELF